MSCTMETKSTEDDIHALEDAFHRARRVGVLVYCSALNPRNKSYSRCDWITSPEVMWPQQLRLA